MKHNKKAIIISVILAITGVISAGYLYQYTHTAKLEQKFNQVQSELEKTNSQLESTVQNKEQVNQQNQELQKQLDELNKIKSDLERQLQARQAEKQRIANVAPKQAQASPVSVTGTKSDWLRASGIPESQWQYVDYIVSKESSWNPNAVNKSSGACGLAQALPCSKIGANWNDPVVALKWQYNYVNARYGGYAGAYNFWLKNKWY